MRQSVVTVLSPVAHKRASCLYSRGQQTFVHVNVRTISVYVMYPSRIICSPRKFSRRSDEICSPFCCCPRPSRWTAVPARGIVVEGMAKKAIRRVRPSCCQGKGMRGGDLELLNYFRTVAQPHKFKILFHMYFVF